MNPECILASLAPASRLHSSFPEGYYTCVRHHAGIRPWIRNASIPITRSAGSRYGPRGRIRFSASRSRESISAVAAPATESYLLHPLETIPEPLFLSLFYFGATPNSESGTIRDIYVAVSTACEHARGA